jgi:hypothetical protein
LGGERGSIFFGACLECFEPVPKRLLFRNLRLGRNILSGILKFHFPPGGGSGGGAGGAALERVIDLDPGRGLRGMDIDPAGPALTGFDLLRPFEKEDCGFTPIGHKEGLHTLMRRMDIPGAKRPDLLYQFFHSFPLEQTCKGFGIIRHTIYISYWFMKFKVKITNLIHLRGLKIFRVEKLNPDIA